MTEMNTKKCLNGIVKMFKTFWKELKRTEKYYEKNWKENTKNVPPNVSVIKR